MAKKKKSEPGTVAVPPLIYEAALGGRGEVIRGLPIDQTAAEARRRTGQDVVVCGPNIADNRRLAEAIERAANDAVKRCPPHATSGPNALPTRSQTARRPHIL